MTRMAGQLDQHKMDGSKHGNICMYSYNGQSEDYY